MTERRGRRAWQLPRGLRIGVAATGLLGGLVVGGRAIGGVPALGPLLDPVHGILASAATAELAPGESQALGGLGDSVVVRYDDRGVPHVFARRTLDAVRAIGYVQARDRLFQMEMTVRAAAGTLTELVGARAAIALDVGQTCATIDLRLAHAQQIEIGAVQDQQGGLCIQGATLVRG
jgi:acyl-homoserine lactone acylase PvdQ